MHAPATSRRRRCARATIDASAAKGFPKIRSTNRPKAALDVERVNAAIAKATWLAGDQISLADLCVLSTIVRMSDLRHESIWSDLPHFQDWYRRIQARPSFAMAYYPGEFRCRWNEFTCESLCDAKVWRSDPLFPVARSTGADKCSCTINHLPLTCDRRRSRAWSGRACRPSHRYNEMLDAVAERELSVGADVEVADFKTSVSQRIRQKLQPSLSCTHPNRCTGAAG